MRLASLRFPPLRIPSKAQSQIPIENVAAKNLKIAIEMKKTVPAKPEIQAQ